MRSLTRTSRALLIAVSIVQTLVPALVAVADAELAARARGAEQAHAEDHSRRSCVPAHSDDCSLCQLLSHLVLRRTGAPVLHGVGDANVRIDRDATSLPSYSARALQRSRAPPVG
jgi:hypothetical protein